MYVGTNPSIARKMLERDQEHKLSGFIELDDVLSGGERMGCKPGRGTVEKRDLLLRWTPTPVVI